MKNQMRKRIACVIASMAILGCSSLAYAAEGTQSAATVPYSLSDYVQLDPHTWVHSGNFKSTTYVEADPEVTSMDINVTTSNGFNNTTHIEGNFGTVGCDYDVASEMIFKITLHFSDGDVILTKSVSVSDNMCNFSHPYSDRCIWSL